MLALQEFTGPWPNMGNLAANAGATLIANITIISATTVNNITMRRISAASFLEGEARQPCPRLLAQPP
jgi:hypothetical protein